jgi:hypothetical protein
VLNVTFLGVRAASTPERATARRYGTDTACVALEVPKATPLLLDLGGGLRRWIDRVGPTGPLRAHALLSRIDDAHLEGLARIPADRRFEVDVFGPESRVLTSTGGERGAARFPSPLFDAAGCRFVGVHDEELVVGDAKVAVRRVPNRGPTNGYRVEWEGVTVAYVSDHRPPAGLGVVAQEVLELADGVDLLVHDARLAPPEWGSRGHEGHSTVDHAVLVAREAGARRLALFHHDPATDDDRLDRLLAGARRAAERLGVEEVIAAAQGTTVSFER